MIRRARLLAWPVILAFAIFEAYAQRYKVGPDGISYLDLSDAVVNGHWSGLTLNTYWSPLYPFLIGVARAVTRVSPANEVPLIHAVNFVAFIGMSAAFEYMLVSVLSLAERTRGSALAGAWGLAGVYGLYAVFAITMIPLELTTPDVLVAGAAFLAFGALLRLRDDAPRPMRHAIVLGVALGLGALAKSFLVPWALVCLATLGIATHRRGLKVVAVAAGVWLVIVLPWVSVLSHFAGRLTVGDTGRLTYAWYVNGQNPPSLGNVPPNARTPRIDSVLPGAGATGDAPGTDPMWFDPARWNAAIAPHLSFTDQRDTLVMFIRFYVQNLTPLLFFTVLLAAASKAQRRAAWRAGWVVYIPALAGVTAYAMVIVTARYIMPFLLAATLVLLATLPIPRRLLPRAALIGLILPIGIEAISPRTVLGLALVASIVGGMTTGVLVSMHRRTLWGIAVVVGLFVTRKVLTQESLTTLRLGSVALVIVIVIAARAAVRDRRPVAFGRRALASMALSLAVVLALRLYLRLEQDAQEINVAANPRWGNVDARIAEDLASRGITPGTRVAVIGPHTESYWARTARVRIVANVPRTRVSDFWKLSLAGRDSLMAAFADAGATVAIATLPPDAGQPDSSWTPVPYRGWIRRLR